MADAQGFLKVKRQETEYRPVCERVKDYAEVAVLRRPEQSQAQASRCMDCGTPFCHWGCPLGNYIPEWNDFVFSGRWEGALQSLCMTNNLPEITGRLCPAPCEYSCVLGINDDPVTIRENELAVIEHAFKAGLIKPRPPARRSGKKAAVIGSGPAGLACADQLNKAGHRVVVFEKDDRAGGILRYGIPDFKLEKGVIDRRLDILKKEGIKFVTGVNAGIDYPAYRLKKEFDAVCLAGGCRVGRDLKIEGRQLKGVHFAMDYLIQANKRANGEAISSGGLIDARDKRVVIIGGGDTGADCAGVAHRQGARCVTQIELLPQPPECRSCDCPWPKYPLLLKTSTSHQEGGIREWSVLTKKFTGEGGYIGKLSCVKVDSSKRDKNGCLIIKEIPGTEFAIDADLVILALGFTHPEHNGLLEELGIEFDAKGNVRTDEGYMTKTKGVFSAGDMHRGQSLVVWAILEGRMAAQHMDKYLMRRS